MAKHRSPVIPSGKSSLQLPPIDPSGRARPGHGSAVRRDPVSNLRNGGAAIMSSQPQSARNLHSYKNGSNGGSDGVRDSINSANKYTNGHPRNNPSSYQPQAVSGGRPPQYVKGDYYGVNVAPLDRVGSRGSPMNQQAPANLQHIYAERPSPSRMSPRGGVQQAAGGGSVGYSQYQSN